MIFKKFYFIVIIQVVLILASCFNLSFLILESVRYHSIVVFALVLIGQLIVLINYFNRTNRDVSFFLDTLIENNIINVRANEGTKASKNLHDRMRNINDTIKKDQLKKEGKSLFYEIAFDKTATGILIFSKTGDIRLINAAATTFFGQIRLTNISQLALVKKGLDQELNDLGAGEEVKLNLSINNEYKKLLAHSTEIIYQGETLKLISLNDIQNHTGIAETEAWHKLFKILSHEIMSSISPITSLSDALTSYLKNEEKAKLPTEISRSEIESTIEGLDIINERSKGLKDFVEGYRTLTDPPTINRESFMIKSLVNNVCVLLGDLLTKNQIQLAIDIENEDFQLQADQALLGQVVINLIKNSVDATQNNETRIITIRAKNKNKKVILEVEDNGCGIEDGELENIFTPFYSTKDQGSGIGLSLSRQIMIQHKGKIFVRSIEGSGSTFALEF